MRIACPRISCRRFRRPSEQASEKQPSGKDCSWPGPPVRDAGRQLPLENLAITPKDGCRVSPRTHRPGHRSRRWLQPACRLLAGAMSARSLPPPLYRQSRAYFQTVKGTSTNTSSVVFFLSVSQLSFKPAVNPPTAFSARQSGTSTAVNFFVMSHGSKVRPSTVNTLLDFADGAPSDQPTHSTVGLVAPVGHLAVGS